MSTRASEPQTSASASAVATASPEVIPARRLTDSRYAMLRRLMKDRLAVIGGLTLLVLIVVAVLAPVLAPYDPAQMGGARLRPPSAQYWLGTDDLGRDLLSRVIWGARVSLSVSLISVLLASTVGIFLGVVAGYFGGWIDSVIMRCMDLLFAFPAILLALAIMAVMGTDIRNLLIAIAIVYIPTFARVARGSTLTVRAQPFIEAGRAVGAGDSRLIGLHVLPNIASPLLVQFSVNLAYAILIEASLSFLGLGIQPPQPSWGSMLARAYQNMELAPEQMYAPGLAILLTALAFNALGESLRVALDPTMKLR